MPSHSNDDSEDAMRAATITPEDVGETPPSQTSRFAPKPLGNTFETSSKVRDFVARMAASVPERNPEHPGHDVENTDADRDHTRQSIVEQAWVTSLRASKKEDLASWRLDALAPDQHPRDMAMLAKALRRPRFRNLVFGGDVGPGKTSTAIALGWAAIDQGLSARFIDHAKYVRWLQTSDSMPKHPHPYWDLSTEQLRTRMTTCNYLVLDDLGRGLDPTAAVTGHVLKATLELIEDRIETPNTVTVVTVNHRSDSIRTMFGDAFLSRLSKAGKAFTFTGPDRRGRLDW